MSMMDSIEDEYEEQITTLKAQLAAAEKQEAILAKFASTIVMDYCWNLFDPDGHSIRIDPDGCRIQKLAAKLGLIEPYIMTANDVAVDFSDFDVGDTIYKFTVWFAEALKNPK